MAPSDASPRTGLRRQSRRSNSAATRLARWRPRGRRSGADVADTALSTPGSPERIEIARWWRTAEFRQKPQQLCPWSGDPFRPDALAAVRISERLLSALLMATSVFSLSAITGQASAIARTSARSKPKRVLNSHSGKNGPTAEARRH